MAEIRCIDCRGERRTACDALYTAAIVRFLEDNQNMINGLNDPSNASIVVQISQMGARALDDTKGELVWELRKIECSVPPGAIIEENFLGAVDPDSLIRTAAGI